MRGLGVSFQERFFLEAEFVTALDNFRPGELRFDGEEKREPKAWNLESAKIPPTRTRWSLSKPLRDPYPARSPGAGRRRRNS